MNKDRIEQSHAASKCCLCGSANVKPDGIWQTTIYAVAGKNFKYWTGALQNQENFCSLFTPLGKAKIVGTYCEACKSASILEFRKSKEERMKLSKSFFKYSVLLLLSGGFSIYFIQQLQKIFGSAIAFGPIILLGLGMLCLLIAVGYYSRKDGEFSMSPSFTKSDFFKEEVSKIAARIDVSGIQIATAGTVFAKVEEDLLLISELGGYFSDCSFGNRLWYFHGAFLHGYTPAGMPGTFFRYYQSGGLHPDGSIIIGAKDKTRIEDDKNRNVEL